MPENSRSRRASVARLLVTGVLLLPAVACKAPPRPEPLDLLREQQEAWNAGNLDGFLAGYDHRGVTFSSSDGMIRGWEPIRQRFRNSYADLDSMGRLTFSRLEVRRLGVDAALVTGRWELERENDSPRGVFTVILSYRDDRWRIIHDHTSRFAPDEPQS